MSYIATIHSHARNFHATRRISFPFPVKFGSTNSFPMFPIVSFQVLEKNIACLVCTEIFPPAIKAVLEGLGTRRQKTTGRAFDHFGDKPSCVSNWGKWVYLRHAPVIYCASVSFVLSPHDSTGFRPALACLERLKDNPSCQPVRLPQHYFQFTEAFSQ